MSNTKKKFAFWLTPKTKELVERSYQLDNSQSQSEFIEKAIQRGFAENSGTDLDAIIPPTSRRRGARERKKQEVLTKIQKLVEIYEGI